MTLPRIISGPNPYVEVERRIGVTYLSRCRIERGDFGSLVVVSIDNPDGYRPVFYAGDWRTAKQFSASEDLEQSWIAPVPVVVPCSLCRLEASHERKNTDNTRTYMCPSGHQTIIEREDQW